MFIIEVPQEFPLSFQIRGRSLLDKLQKRYDLDFQVKQISYKVDPTSVIKVFEETESSESSINYEISFLGNKE